VIPAPLRLRLSLAALAEVARDLRRSGMQGGGAWRGVLRQVRRYADELRWVLRERAVADDARRPT
jgi:hypothetical protein